MNSNQTSSQTASSNRISFSSQPLQNGVINIGGGGHPTILTSSQIPATTTIKTITSSGLIGGIGVGGGHHQHITTAVSAAGVQHHMQIHPQQPQHPQSHQITQHQVLNQPSTNSGNIANIGPPSSSQAQQSLPTVGATQTQTLVIKSNHAVTLPAGFVSNAPGIVNMSKTLQQQQNTQPLINSMLPANVVVGVRQTPGQQQAKTVPGNTIGRVVIGGTHVVNNRPNSPAITLSTLSAGQAPALILKTENGFQLLRVGPANTGPVTQTIATNSTNSTQIRLQTVPATSMTNASAPINTIVNSVSPINTELPVQQVYNTSSTNISLQQPQTAQPMPSSQQQPQQLQSLHQSHTLQQSQHQIQQLQQPPQTITSNVLNSIQTHPAHQQFTHSTAQQTIHNQSQITQIQNIPAPTTNQMHQTTTTMTTQQHQNSTITNHNSGGIVNNVNGGTLASGTTSSTATSQNAVVLGNTKEKCRKFLANLIDLSTREPKPVERNVRSLIQELINANVEPEDFCDRLERLLNASPQPCLIGFLKKSLPLLRHALYNKELVIEGIKPPPQQAVIGLATIQQQFSKIQAQIRPISQHQTATIGQTQVRMISPSTVTRPICHPAIAKNTVGGLRIQSPSNSPRLLNAHIRGSSVNTPQIQTASPTNANIVQLRTPVASSINRPATVQIRTGKGKNANSNGGITPGTTTLGSVVPGVGLPTATATITNSPASGATNLMHIKVGQTQIKAISSASSANAIQPPSLVAISNNIVPTNSNISSSASILSTINSVASNTIGNIANLPVPSLPTVQLPPAILAQQQHLHQQNTAIIQHNNIGSSLTTAHSLIDAVKVNDIKSNGKPILASVPHHITSISTSLSPTTTISTIVTSATAPILALSSTLITPSPILQSLPTTTIAVSTNNKLPAKSTATTTLNKSAPKKKKDNSEKERDEVKFNNSNSTSNAVAMSSFYQQPSISMSSYGDDDINDVAAMGGVNLAEESQRILGSTENIGTQIRSCKDEVFLNLPSLQSRIRNIVAAEGLEEPAQEVAMLLSHACQERLKNIVEKLVVIAEHRIDVIKLDPRYDISKDVRGQIKFLEELDKAEQKRHEELEREILLRAAKSRSKIEDPEQAKMKARAKEMQRAEMEELRQRDANMTALQAIGPRKKMKIDSKDTTTGGATGTTYNSMSAMGSAPPPLRPRIKRVNLRDMIFFMEQERDMCRSEILYKAYLK